MIKKIKLFTFLAFTFLISKAQLKNFIDQPYIELSGSADSLVTPNEIFIKIYISEKDSRDRISVEQYETQMVDTLKAMGINTEMNLTTNDLGSNYKYYLIKHKDILKSKQYILKVGDAIIATKVFMLLEDMGISNVSIDHVDHSDKSKIKNLTRIKAIEDAKDKAIILTKPLNQNIGKAIFITDNETYGTAQMLSGRVSGLMVRGYSHDKLKDNNELPKIEFEKIRISTEVSVKFILN